MINRKRIIRLADAFLAATLVTIIATSGWLDDLDNRFSDKFYQDKVEKSRDVIVIGIDKITLSKIGPKASIGRRDMARAIDYLNNNNPDARPAVIGIDGLFTGENSADPEGDRLLAEAAAQYGNVVVDSEADLDEEDIFSEETKDFYQWYKTWTWIPPFAALAEVAETGHVNAPNESDGIVRHDLCQRHGARAALFFCASDLRKILSCAGA